MTTSHVITLLSSSPRETEAIGCAVGRALPWGSVVGLVGELGSGKTEMVRGIVAGLGGADEVSSPTFVLEQVYPLPGGRQVAHWDLYRLPPEPELPELRELVGNPECMTVVEWSDRAGWLEPLLSSMVELVVDPEGESFRQIRIRMNESAEIRVLKELEETFPTLKIRRSEKM